MCHICPTPTPPPEYASDKSQHGPGPGVDVAAAAEEAGDGPHPSCHLPTSLWNLRIYISIKDKLSIENKPLTNKGIETQTNRKYNDN